MRPKNFLDMLWKFLPQVIASPMWSKKVNENLIRFLRDLKQFNYNLLTKEKSCYHFYIQFRINLVPQKTKT